MGASDESAAGLPGPTVVLVHGAFADSTSWAAVGSALTARGLSVLAVANPLRDLEADGTYVASVLATIEGPVVLVGHSYAGSVITRAAAESDGVAALVYVAAFIPTVGESSGELNGKFPGSQLTPDNLVARPTADGHTDLYLRADRFGEVYAGGLDAEAVAVAALAQRPITNEALGGILTKAPRRALPAWQVVATADNAVPTELQRFLAERAGAHVVEADSGHDVPAARPGAVVEAVLAAVSAIA
ncbi:alpha/beta fold hydrolase [Pseudonocardia sp. WMMC193]|uniref:alpha/beta fold hydrolase n=1 Tax=Pseudonocardia sp. WMMC193 TaxID=2911965 RepID=UPI001F1F854B|nr:alpha/beta hydrolase [Pseudonocardia sp. WMMC193]MCF7552308.1 alpha/beta hydrolase [Pseudonocardia sp. WMMC193]